MHDESLSLFPFHSPVFLIQWFSTQCVVFYTSRFSISEEFRVLEREMARRHVISCIQKPDLESIITIQFEAIVQVARKKTTQCAYSFIVNQTSFGINNYVLWKYLADELHLMSSHRTFNDIIMWLECIFSLLRFILQFVRTSPKCALPLNSFSSF